MRTSWPTSAKRETKRTLHIVEPSESSRASKLILNSSLFRNILILIVLSGRTLVAVEIASQTNLFLETSLSNSTPGDKQQPSSDIERATGSYQAALIGFRCESGCSADPVTGLTVIEANSPSRLTLFGEDFTKDTIIAFTSQRQTFSDNNKVNRLANRSFLGPEAPSSEKFGAYDCTDYNRVTSFSLSDADILSPNVASITITLPETDSKFGTYFYFCLKQRPLVLGERANHQPPANGFGEANNKNLSQSETQTASQRLVWLHQGDAWWLTIKVEPPILSITNDCLLIALLLFLSAVTSGLNLGLMSLDMNELAVISSCGDPHERSYARTIAPLRRRGNYLLCSLLLGNVLVNSTLTIIIEEMTSGLIAVISGTLAIVVLGEILPQAMCARQGLAIGAKTIYLTYLFMIITFPLSYPISCLLDYVLGEEKGNVYDRERLMEFIKITGHHTQLEADEVAIISGALKLKKIKVDQIMTRIEDVFMLPIDCKLDRETIKRIIEKGYSRVPIYEFGDRKQIVALILAKDLALLDPDDHTPVSSMLLYCKHPLIFIEDDVTLDVALNEFKTGKSHMAVVRQIYDDGECDKYYEAIGVVTLEDVIEEVLQTEINDETDTLSDNRRKRRRTGAQVAHLIDEFAAGSLSNPMSDLSLEQQQQRLKVPTSYQANSSLVLLGQNGSGSVANSTPRRNPLSGPNLHAGGKQLVESLPKPESSACSSNCNDQQFWSLNSWSQAKSISIDPEIEITSEARETDTQRGNSSLLERFSSLLANIFR